MPLSLFESMKQVAYISVIAMASITFSFLYIIWTDIVVLENSSFDSTLTMANFAGIPYFFGIASFMFEGNALALEIY